MKHLSLFLFIGLLSLSTPSFCQTKVLKGSVTDQSGEAIPFAPILVKGTKISCLTDADGKFQLQLKDTTITLEVKYLGYASQEVIVKKGETSVHITMFEDLIELDEVVVKEDRIYDRASVASYSMSLTAPEESFGSVKTLYRDPNAKSGVLTAGEINDFGKWILWKDIENSTLEEWKNLWRIHPQKRFCIQVTNEDGMPVVDAKAELRNNSGIIFWQSRTDNTGKAELWLNLFGESGSEKNLSLYVTQGGKTYSLPSIKEFHAGVNFLAIPAPCKAPQAIDVAFVVDATGSMQDEIDYLKAELNNIVTKVKDSLPEKDLNLGSIFYRDNGDEYITKSSPLTSDIQQTVRFIKENNAGGGGDYPEALDQALNSAINHLAWRDNASARILFLILDAPPHDNTDVIAQLQNLIARASEKGIRIVPVACSGIDKSTEYLLRSMALATNGTYVFLTDHSGVGNHHIEPTTDKYDVELLNNVLFRVINNFSSTQSCDPPLETISPDTITVMNPAHESLVIDSSAIHAGDSVSTTQANDSTSVSQEFYNWKFFPNPTFGIVNVKVDGMINELFVTDLSGKIIMRVEVRGE